MPAFGRGADPLQVERARMAGEDGEDAVGDPRRLGATAEPFQQRCSGHRLRNRNRHRRNRRLGRWVRGTVHRATIEAGAAEFNVSAT